MSRSAADTRGVSLVAAIVLFGVGLWWLIRHPRFTVPFVVLVVSVWRLGPMPTGRLCLLVLVGLAVWWWRYRRTFDRFVSRPFRSWWRSWWVYGRRWKATMRLASLAKRDDQGVMVRPKLRAVEAGPIYDRVDVKMRLAQTLGDWEQESEGLANTFGALACRVLPVAPGRLRLELKTRDVLIDIVPALPIPAEPRLDAAAIGRTERGDTWWLPLLGHHDLVAGRTGAGKGSVLWSLIRYLSPLIRAGLVQLWVCDPKRGMEFGFGRPMFHRFETETAPMIRLLRDAVAGMQERGDRLQGVTRLHTPTVDDPLVLVLVDEFAALTDVLGDRRQREEAENLLRLLLQQGRAIGYSVIGALQDPSKSGLRLRGLFTVRVALGLNEPTEPDMVLGAGSRSRGALCDRIPQWAKGTGYVLLDGEQQPTMVRAGHVTDPDIHDMAATYPAGPHPEDIEDSNVIDLRAEDVHEEVPA